MMRKMITKEEYPEPEPLTVDEIRTLYQRAFKILNRDFFNSELQPIQIDYFDNFIDAGQDVEAAKEKMNAEAFFYYDPDRIEEPIIVLKADIDALPPDTGINTDDIDGLYHEMIHYYCYQNNIKDHADHTQWHNATFKQVVENHGGKCYYVDSRSGYMKTELPQDYLLKVLYEI